MDLGITGRVAVVTGGRTGIGYACALALAREGVDIAICSRDAELLRTAADVLERDTGRRVLPLPADLTNADEAGSMVDQVVQEFGRLDILVNCAGASRFGNPLELDED